ncbi:hypothetical protein AB1Y20_003638 [Prymnesium parvum]|uniref:Palmitoyltransferase n=1 Tax=Prymnesium parvum TaxID=97485 RepID=A0AB34J5U8_PRYPA
MARLTRRQLLPCPPLCEGCPCESPWRPPGSPSALRPAPRWRVPHSTALLTWSFMLALPAAGFLSLVAPFVARELTTPMVSVVSIALFAVASLLMLITSSMDPGTVRLAPLGLRRAAAPPASHEVLVRGIPVALKYCPVCDFRRPPRTSHCRETDRCIDKWDHYCPWVGNAVGRRNYPFFVCFIATTSAFASHTAASCARQLLYVWGRPAAGGTPSLLSAVGRMPFGFALLLYSSLAAMLLSVLSLYHFYLISINQTTYENVRRTYAEGKVNPFDNGCLANWKEVFCAWCSCRRVASHSEEESWGMLPHEEHTSNDEGEHLPLSRVGETELQHVAVRGEGLLPSGEAPPSPHQSSSGGGRDGQPQEGEDRAVVVGRLQ